MEKKVTVLIQKFSKILLLKKKKKKKWSTYDETPMDFDILSTIFENYQNPSKGRFRKKF